MRSNTNEAKRSKKKGKLSAWFNRKKTWQKVLIIAMIVVLILVTAIGGYALFQYSKINRMDLSDEELSCVDVDGYLNILLLGVDSRNMDDISGTGADAIMILSLKEETGEITLTSIYRDTYLKMADSDNCYKITDINRAGGPEALIKTLNQAMDLNISKYAVVNFKAVSDLVNAVGGITVDVEDYEIEQLNKYTKQTAYNIGQDDYQLVTQPGEQTLEGVQAVSYGRIRKGVGDDFKRTERMRIVINLVLDKLKLNDIKQLNGIMNAVLPNVQTNMKMRDMLILASKLTNFTITKGDGWPYEVTTGMLGGISYVFATDLEENVKQLHEKIFGREGYDPTQTVKDISALLNANRSGAANQQVVDPQEEANKDDPTPNKNSGTSTSGQKSDSQNSNSSDSNKNTNKDTNKNNNNNNNSSSDGNKDNNNPSTEPETPGTDEPAEPETPGTDEPEPSNPDTPDTPETPDPDGGDSTGEGSGE
ncbi:MAG: LCP family protein [Eubacteriaceae bacterium]|nr:LCP family protein [Eubacteriaceae bacterium]